jgi:hypothetical protein
MRGYFNDKKWKEFSKITAISTLVIVSQIGWANLLVRGTSKIPYIGIPVSIFLGSAGVFGAIWIARGSNFAYKEWYKTYCIK